MYLLWVAIWDHWTSFDTSFYASAHCNQSIKERNLPINRYSTVQLSISLDIHKTANLHSNCRMNAIVNIDVVCVFYILSITLKSLSVCVCALYFMPCRYSWFVVFLLLFRLLVTYLSILCTKSFVLYSIECVELFLRQNHIKSIDAHRSNKKWLET